jgi:CRP-like cAMP-binding protein
VRNYASSEVIVAQGGKPSNCCLVLDGFVAREKAANVSDRQIISFYVPGDIPDAATLHLAKMDHSLIGIGPVVVGFIPHDSLHVAISQSSELLHALWRETLIDAAILRQWVVNLGQREGVAMMAETVSLHARYHLALMPVLPQSRQHEASRVYARYSRGLMAPSA